MAIAQKTKEFVAGCLVLLAIAAGAAWWTGGGTQGNSTQSEAKVLDLKFATIGRDIFTVVIPAGALPDDIDRATRKHCARKEFCKVMGWTDADRVATAMPMSNREAAALAYDLTINRNSGMDRSLFACSSWKNLPPERCLATQTEGELENAS